MLQTPLRGALLWHKFILNLKQLKIKCSSWTAFDVKKVVTCNVTKRKTWYTKWRGYRKRRWALPTAQVCFIHTSITCLTSTPAVWNQAAPQSGTLTFIYLLSLPSCTLTQFLCLSILLPLVLIFSIFLSYKSVSVSPFPSLFLLPHVYIYNLYSTLTLILQLTVQEMLPQINDLWKTSYCCQDLILF